MPLTIDGRLGVYAYMAPEQARGKAVDRRVDIWAFGAVLYEMLTGRRAFEGDDISITLANVLGQTLGVSTPRQFATLPAETIWVDAMPDRQRFLAIAPERTGTGSVTVVQNWLAALATTR